MSALTAAQALCTQLDERKASYTLSIIRDSLLVTVSIPGERWEIEFFDDGRIELERFVSQGVSDSPTAPKDVLAYFDE